MKEGVLGSCRPASICLSIFANAITGSHVDAKEPACSAALFHTCPIPWIPGQQLCARMPELQLSPHLSSALSSPVPGLICALFHLAL